MKRSTKLQFRVTDSEYNRLVKLWQDYQLSDWGDSSYTLSDIVRISIAHEFQRVHESREIPTDFTVFDSDLPEIL